MLISPERYVNADLMTPDYESSILSNHTLSLGFDSGEGENIFNCRYTNELSLLEALAKY